jgi:hypothetical protein
VATGAAIARLVDTVHLEACAQAPLALVNLVEPSMELPVRMGGKQFQATVRTVVQLAKSARANLSCGSCSPTAR